MARGTPSVAALLGMLAIAGYQNRDKIGQWLGGLKNAGGSNDPLGGLLGGGRDQRSSGGGWGQPQASLPAQGFDAALDTIARQTGLSRDEIQSRLSRVSPV